MIFISSVNLEPQAGQYSELRKVLAPQLEQLYEVYGVDFRPFLIIRKTTNRIGSTTSPIAIFQTILLSLLQQN